MTFRIVRLAPEHDRAGFDCGEPALNDFLRRFARQQAARDFNRTYVAVDGDDLRVRGFYSLSAGAIEFQHWPAGLKLPRYPVPVARIGRLAVDKGYHRRGIAGALLQHALLLSASLSSEIGLHAVVVDAKHALAGEFYAHFGFRPFQDASLSLFLTITTIRRASIDER